MKEATHIISAVFFPGRGELELTWEDIATGERASLLVQKVTQEEGLSIAKVVPPCVYSNAALTCASMAQLK